MGDVGSLSLGAILGVFAILLRLELLFALMAGVLVIEALIVMLQIISVKTCGRKIFLITPIHHYFETKNYLETKIVKGFNMLTILLILLTFTIISALK